MNLQENTSTYAAANVPLFYYSVKNFSQASVIDTVNVSNFIAENNPEFNTFEKMTPIVYPSGSEYLLPVRFRNLPSGSILVTDRATTSKYLDYAIPLYYEYELMYNHYSPETVFPEGFITLRKNNQSNISTDSYVVESRVYSVASGRYSTTNTGDWQWSSNAVSGNVITARVLLPTRTNQNHFYTVEYNRHLANTNSQYWKELIDEKQLYLEDTDYTLTPSSVIMSDSTRMVSGNVLYVQKNPDTFVTFKSPASSSDRFNTRRWEFSIGIGNFVQSSGLMNTGYTIFNTRSDTSLSSIPTQTEPPVIVGKNIIRVAHRPLIAPSSQHPTPEYIFTDVVDKMHINGVEYKTDITSIDSRRGYIMLSKNINSTDDLIVDYNSDPSKVLVVRNVDLNPMFSENNIIDTAASGLGVALVPSGTTFYDSDSTAYTNNWSNVVMYSLVDNQYGDFTSGVFGWGASAFTIDQLPNGPVSGIIPSGSRFLGSMTINISPEENLDLIDIRRKGGYDQQMVVNNVSDWRSYSDIGYWDGEPLPLAGTVIMQIPSVSYKNILEIFNSDDELVLANSEYPEELAKVLDKDSSENYNRNQMVMHAANKYISDTIERYLPAGVTYIIVDENMVPWPTIRRDL